ncbi:MAG TPA: EAL domain-containing protein [Xanthomonadaceae bacterium]|nr:EAL domain-containing protein [Xanthomonadaceae bacterium]
MEVKPELVEPTRLLLGLPAWAWGFGGLLLGLLATTALLALEYRDLAGEARVRHALMARSTIGQVERQLESAGLQLRALQSAYLVASGIDEARFAGIVANLDAQRMVPSLLAVAYAPRTVDAAGRVHYAYTQVAPLESNHGLLGLDIVSQPENLVALARARDLDAPVLSTPFRLLQPARDPRDSDGLVLRLPVFTPGPRPTSPAERRRREAGALAMSVRVRPLLLDALSPTLRQYHVRVVDVTAAERVLFDEGAQAAGEGRYGGVLEYGGRRWQLSLQPAQRATGPLLWTFGIGGGVASVLFALLLWSIASTRRRAITLGWQMSARFRESEARFRTLNELLPALVLMARADDGTIVYANEAACARLGEGVTSTTLAALFEDETLHARLEAHDADTAWSNVEAVLVSLNGDRFWAATSISRVRLGEQDRLLVVATDISEQRQLTELLSYQASHDTLTELYNRREFERQVQRALYGLGKDGPPAALLYLDLDQFKLINDTSGHLAGDQLLSQLALAMAEQLRGGDILARLGGDEFGILAHDTRMEGAQALAERLRARIEGFVYVWQKQSYTVSVSIGVVLLDHPGATLGEALSQADAACYIAKDRGRNRVHFYSEQDDEAVRRRGEMEWANRLRWVVEEGRLLLHYQQVVPLQEQGSGEPYIELLLRLRDEDGQTVFPGAFLPAAERYGMMPLLDRWVIANALSHFDRLHASGRAPGCCAINLAASTLEDEGLADYVLDLVARHGVEPRRLCFEITETEAMRNVARAMRFIERVRAVGCKVALDDFGAGMSSFGYLKNLPVDTIKIDGSFVRDIEADTMSRSIVESICKIGHQRGLDVVAEWVADHGVVPLLRELGVDYGQGFALHRPEPALFQR